MSRPAPSRIGLLLVSLTVALIMQVVPLFGESVSWRPQFVQLVVIFFLLYQPLRYGVACAWLVGLGLDVLHGGVFGKYALALGVSAYLLTILQPRLKHAMIWYQCGVVLLLVVATQLIALSVNLLTQNSASWSAILHPAISSALVWPLVYLVLDRLQRR